MEGVMKALSKKYLLDFLMDRYQQYFLNLPFIYYIVPLAMNDKVNKKNVNVSLKEECCVFFVFCLEHFDIFVKLYVVLNPILKV